MLNMKLTGIAPEIETYINELEKQLQEQDKSLETMQLRINQLMEQLAKAQRSLYGQSSEKSKYVLNDSYMDNLFNEAEFEAQSHAPEPRPTTVTSHTRKPKRTKEELAAQLPVTEVICELAQEDQVCDECNSNMRALGRETVREEIEFIPAQVRLLRYIRLNFVCENCEKETGEATIKKALVPAPVIKKSMASPSAVAHVLYQKYVNAMPLYRQEKDWANQGVDISRATLANWIIAVAFTWLILLWDEMKSCLLTQEIILADETVVQVLKEEGRKPTTDSRMWVYCSGVASITPIVLYEYQTTRSGDHARRFLEGFSGYLHTDGYAGYDRVPGVTRCGCWNHLRSKYRDCIPKTKNEALNKDSPAYIGFDFCNQLFDLEREFKEMTADERLKERQIRSKKVLDDYLAWLDTTNPLQGAKLGEAITYSRNQQIPLSRFLEDGCIELSTNRVENHIRPFVIGRKNWLFADTSKGAKASAIAYSIVETAKANNLNVYQYLVYIFSTMPSLDLKRDPSLIENLLPWSPNLPDSCRKQKH